MPKALLSALIAACVALPIAAAPKPDTGEKVEFKVYAAPYFEKNNSGLKGEASFVALADKNSFDMVFGVGFVMGKKPDVLTPDDFDKKLVAAVIKRGNAISTYKVESVTGTEDALFINYTVKTGDPGTATYASPLIVAVDKGKYKSVTFVENGKKAGTAEIGK
jgi:hypothetical protein